MNKNLKKRLKLLCKIALWILAGLVVLIVLSPLWIGPVAKTAANIVVPKITGTPFRISELHVNPYSGYMHVGGVVLENPSFFKAREAFTLGNLDIKMSVPSLLTDVIKIKEIAVSDIFVAYISEKGTNNFDVIASNASGEEKSEIPNEQPSRQVSSSETSAAPDRMKADSPSADVAGSAKRNEAAAPVAAEDKSAQGESSKKVEIEHLSINNLSVKMGFLRIPLPPISLSDIGKNSGGVSFMELWTEILAVVIKSAGAVGGAVKDLGTSLFNGATNATEGAANVLLDAGSSLKEAGKSLKNLFK